MNTPHARKYPHPGAAVRLSEQLLTTFDNWFCSTAGVWHTLFIVIAIVILERIFPGLDPGMFALMVWLTIYSGVTQPALAHTGRESADRIEAMEQHMEQILEHIEATLAPRETR